MGPYKMAYGTMAYICMYLYKVFVHSSLKFCPLQEHLEADPVVAGRPIVLQSKDGHAIWVSAKVLNSIKPMPDEVEGGVIVRDGNGNPTG